MSSNSLLETGAKSEAYVTATRRELTTTWYLSEHSTMWFWVRVSLQSFKSLVPFCRRIYALSVSFKMKA